MIAVLGAGAFGTALAVALARGGKPVTLWGRRIDWQSENPKLPGADLTGITVTQSLGDVTGAQIILAALPMQALAAFLGQHSALFADRPVIACCKGLDLTTGLGPTGVIAAQAPRSVPAVLSGPSFAADIARGLPTALTLAAADPELLQQALSTPHLRLYRSSDPTGVELGGALKNVIAIACGAAIGAGLGESARAALMTRGFAEIQRLATPMGAQAETLLGLSGFGDLALTCGSDLSRNYRFGRALGQGVTPPRQETVEGVATARAATDLADRLGLDLPIVRETNQICSGQTSIPQAIQSLLSRPLKAE